MHSETGFNSRKLMPKKKEHIAAGLYVTCSTRACNPVIISSYFVASSFLSSRFSHVSKSIYHATKSTNINYSIFNIRANLSDRRLQIRFWPEVRRASQPAV